MNKDKHITKELGGKSLGFWFILIAVFVAGIILDQITKALAMNNLNSDTQINIIGDFLYLTYLRNFGASFGMLGSWKYSNILFFIVSLIGIPLFLMILWLRRNHHIIGSIGLALMVSGAVGNGIDRIVFSSSFYDGYVRDFIGVKGFAVFNVADSCMCVGVALLVISMLFVDEDAVFKNRNNGNNENNNSEYHNNSEDVSNKNNSVENNVNNITELKNEENLSQSNDFECQNASENDSSDICIEIDDLLNDHLTYTENSESNTEDSFNETLIDETELSGFFDNAFQSDDSRKQDGKN